MSTVLGLFSGLFDDAALFPPVDAPMTAAVPAHRALREDFGELVGPFIVPATRLDELASCLDDGPPFGISLIAAPGTLPAAADALARGTSPGAAAECLAQRDGATVAGQLRTWSPARAERAQALFTSFGTCSVLEPVEDLVALGLLPTMERMSS